MSRIRLDRLLANLGYGSRREVHALLARGEVRLGGLVVDDPERKVELAPALEAELEVGGEPLDPLPGLLLALHKPLGFTCSHKDEGRLVYELLPERWRRRSPALQTVGRLDKDSSGLLLLTDDGALLHRIVSPKAAVEKRYLVGLARPLAGTEGAALASGTLRLRGEETALAPVRFEATGERSASVWLTEGRYHQVRRMFAALGNHVESLQRERIGGLGLDTVPEPGAYRRIRPRDLKIPGIGD